MNYYVAEGTTQRGPFNDEEIAGVALRPETLVWHEGMSQWQPASQVPELLPFLGGQTAPEPVTAPDPTIQKPPFVTAPYATPFATFPPPADISGKKIAAGICGILFGTFGVHKFILGLSGGAVTMLVVSLVSIGAAPFTCGITILALAIMHIIGIIEGIIYLSRSDGEFYQTYMVQKRQWF